MIGRRAVLLGGAAAMAGTTGDRRPGVGQGVQPAPMNAPETQPLSIGVQPGVPNVIRARLVIISGTGPNVGLFVYSPTPAAGNLVYSITAAAGTDPYGNIYFQGATSYIPGAVPEIGPFLQLLQANLVLGSNAAATKILQNALINLKDALVNATAPQLNLVSPSTSGVLNVGRSQLSLLGTSQDGTAVLKVASDTIAAWDPNVAAHSQPETWHAMTLINGWANAGGAQVAAQYRLVASPLNSVEIIGRIFETAKTADIFSVLPALYRPAHTQGFAAHVAVATTGTAVATTAGVQCDSGGNLTLVGYAAGTTTIGFYFHGFISLDA